MSRQLGSEQLAALRGIDTPTVCNAIETFQVRGRVEGFLGMDIRFLLPELGTMVGYAITVTVDSTTPDVPRSEEAWLAWLKAMEASPKPSVLVLKDVGPEPRRSAHFGEAMGTVAKRLVIPRTDPHKTLTASINPGNRQAARINGFPSGYCARRVGFRSP